eukprot:EG_transcript_17598
MGMHIPRIRAALLLLVAAIPFLSAVPANEQCANATPVLPNDVVTGTTVGAAPYLNFGSCEAYTAGPTVWYVLDLPAGVLNITIDLCSSPATGYDSQLSVLSGDNCSNLSCYDFNDDTCGLLSMVSGTNPPAGRYYIAVDGVVGIIPGSSSGPFTLSIASFFAASPSVSASVSVSPSVSPSAPPSPSPSPNIQPLLAALTYRSATTVLSLTAADLALLAAVAPAATLVGPTCNTSVASAVTQCVQSVPASISLAALATPADHVQCWGHGVQAAVVSQCEPSVASIRALGLTPPNNLAANTVLQVLIVDRSDASGNLQNGQPVSLLLPGTSPTGWVVVVVYSGGDTVGVDLTSIG